MHMKTIYILILKMPNLHKEITRERKRGRERETPTEYPNPPRRPVAPSRARMRATLKTPTRVGVAAVVASCPRTKVRAAAARASGAGRCPRPSAVCLRLER